jgi:hypothetical protein
MAAYFSGISFSSFAEFTVEIILITPMNCFGMSDKNQSLHGVLIFSAKIAYFAL